MKFSVIIPVCNVAPYGQVKISRDRVFLVLAFLLPLLAMVVNLTFGILPWDADYFEYVGWVLSKGGRMYADIWDCKGPCLYSFYALAHDLMPSTAAAGGILSMVLWVASVGLVHRTAKRDFASGKPGLCALLFVLFAQGSTMMFNLGRQEMIGVVCALAGMSLLQVGEGLPPVGWKRGIGFGVCVGIAFMTKATMAAFGGVPLALLILRSMRTDGSGRALVRFVVSSFVGFTGSLCAISVLFCGSWDNVLRMVDASILYNVLERGTDQDTLLSIWHARIQGILHGYRMWICREAWTLPVFSWALVLSFLFRSPPDDVRLPLLRIWLALEIVAVVLVKTSHPHYLMIAAVPVSLMLTMPFLRIRWPGRSVSVFAYGFSALVILWAVAVLVRHLDFRMAHYGNAMGRVRTLVPDPRFAFLKGKRIATQGSACLAISLLHWQVFSRNPYCGWSYWIDFCSDERREAILSGFEAAIADGDNEWLASELTKEELIRKYGQDRPTMKRALDEYEFCNRDSTSVNLYRRKASR